MDVKDYELLLALAEQKNITKVSQSLFITQPAITKRIQRMEEELNCELFLRSKKGVLLTPPGEAILPYARNIVQNNRIMYDLVSSAQEELCGTLSLGSSLNFAHYRLPRILKEYTEKYPKVDVQVVTGQSRDLIQRLQKGEISIAIVRGQFDFDGETKQLSSESMCFVCSMENRDRPLSSYPYIARHTDNMLQERMQRWLRSQGLGELRPKFRMDDIDTCKEMVLHGLGWCILPEICLDNFSGYKKELFLEQDEPFVRKTYIMYRKPYDELPQVQLFLQALEAPARKTGSPIQA